MLPKSGNISNGQLCLDSGFSGKFTECPLVLKNASLASAIRAVEETIAHFALLILAEASVTVGPPTFVRPMLFSDIVHHSHNT